MKIENMRGFEFQIPKIWKHLKTELLLVQFSDYSRHLDAGLLLSLDLNSPVIDL